MVAALPLGFWFTLGCPISHPAALTCVQLPLEGSSTGLWPACHNIFRTQGGAAKGCPYICQIIKSYTKQIQAQSIFCFPIWQIHLYDDRFKNKIISLGIHRINTPFFLLLRVGHLLPTHNSLYLSFLFSTSRICENPVSGDFALLNPIQSKNYLPTGVH